MNRDHEATQLSARNRARILDEFLSPRYPESIQEESLRGMFATGSSEAANLLVKAYPALNVQLRAIAIDLLLEQTGGQSALLAAVEAGTLGRVSLDASRRDKLLSSSDPAIRSAAERVFGFASRSNRAEVVQAMLPSAEKKGSADNGRAVFQKHCSACHRLEDTGFAVGPDLRALTNRDPLWLLTAMLDPNKDVDARYLSWTALTIDGRIVSGMVVEETATSIRLREAGGKEHTIQRNEIETFLSQKSLMPEGLERDLSLQDFSDVIAYLGELVSTPKRFPGNHPLLVASGADGIVALTAATAEIRGTQIRFETPFANIGYWHDQSDSVTWRFELADSGTFDIYLNVSCDPVAAGNEFRIDGLPEPITRQVSSTGGWDRYRQFKIATTTLPAGQHQIVVQAASPVRHALFDLREVRLVPAGRDPGFVTADQVRTPLPRYPPEIAPFLLDDSQSIERRQQVIEQRPGMGPAIISVLTSQVDASDEAEVYRR
ncbi:MAG: c-type cytochrome, partial [Planctomycetes bacterium]|nr:c-type cytochrome [Planctomycetota bacterium]